MADVVDNAFIEPIPGGAEPDSPGPSVRPPGPRPRARLGGRPDTGGIPRIVSGRENCGDARTTTMRA